AEAGVPGMRRSAPGTSPAKIAMAEQATMAPTAATGSMKKVSGTSIAVAMVAVRPGTAPTKSPNIEAAMTESKTFQLATRPAACRMMSISVSYQGKRGIRPKGKGTSSIVRKIKSQAKAPATAMGAAFAGLTLKIRNMIKEIMTAVGMKPSFREKRM